MDGVEVVGEEGHHLCDVLGQTWLAATNLRDAFERLIRYQSVLTNAVSEISLARDGGQYHIRAAYPDRERMPLPHGRDMNMSALIRMCSIAVGTPVRPEKIELIAPSDWHPEAYAELFGCPGDAAFCHNSAKGAQVR